MQTHRMEFRKDFLPLHRFRSFSFSTLLSAEPSPNTYSFPLFFSLASTRITPNHQGEAGYGAKIKKKNPNELLQKTLLYSSRSEDGIEARKCINFVIKNRFAYILLASFRQVVVDDDGEESSFALNYRIIEGRSVK